MPQHADELSGVLQTRIFQRIGETKPRHVATWVSLSVLILIAGHRA